MNQIFFIISITFCFSVLGQEKIQINNHSNYEQSFISKIELNKVVTKHDFELSVSRIGLGKYQDYSKLLERVTKRSDKKYTTALGFSIKGEKLKRYYYPISEKFNYEYFNKNINNKEDYIIKINTIIYKTDSVPVLIIDSIKFQK